MCAGDVYYVLICSCEGAEEFGPVKDLKIELGCSLYFFVMREDSSRLYKIIRLKVIDIGSDLAVVDLYSLLFKDGCSLGRVVIGASDNESRMLCEPCEAVHGDASDTYEIDT